MSGEFEDRHVVVTGGNGALGIAVVRALVERGATCHLPLRGKADGPAFAGLPAERLRLAGGVDLTQEDAVRAFYAGLPRGLWASVHLAGGFDCGTIVDTPLDQLSSLWSMNAASCFLCCREAVRAMRSGGTGGRIVNVAARPALEPRAGAGMVAYAMTKAAVAALTVALGEEVAAEGIWVNAVAPSILDTPANRASMPKADFSRWPKLDEVAATIAFLASPRNAAGRSGLVPVYGRS